MVAPCGAGNGVIKPGFGRTVVMSAAAIEELVAVLIGGPSAIFLAPLLAGQTYDLLNICTTGDPGDPVLTAGDFVDAVNFGDIVANGTAWLRIRQWFLHVMWPSWCNCSNGTIPATPTFVTPPVPTINPGLPGGGVSGGCWDAQGSFTSVSTLVINQDFQSILPPTPTQAINPANWPPITTGRLLPAGFLAFTLDATINTLPSAGSVFISISWHNAAGAQLRIDPAATFTPISLTTFSGTFTPPALSTAMVVTGEDSSGLHREVLLRARWTCTAVAPNTLITPCCPPDSSLDSRLNYLIQLAHANIGLTGQSLKGHVDGTRHAGLSGAGTVTLVDSVQAIRVEIKTGLSALAFNPGDPNYYFSAGFVTPIAAGTPLRGSRLIYAAQTFPIASYVDQIGFTLPPAQTVDIVELLPAP